MRRFALALALAFSSPLLPQSALAQKSSSADSVALRAAIDKGNATFIRAWQTRDADLFASLFAEDGAMLRPGGGVTIGREKIRARMREVFSRLRMTEGTITTADVFLIGDTAYETGAWNFTIGPIGSTTAEPDSGYYVEIWKRDRSGAWRMWRDIGVPKGSAAGAPGAPPSPGAPGSPPSPRAAVPAAAEGSSGTLGTRGREPKSARFKAIRFGRLVDGKGHSTSNALVVVEGDRILWVGPYSSTRIPAGADLIDLSRLTGIPGMIDAHTHMTYWWDRSAGSRPWQQLEQRAPMQTMFLAQENARRTLETGVTTVRDLGSFQYMDIAMRDLINRGAMVGPRMFVSGYGLYPTYTPYQDAPQPPSGGLADGVEQVMRVTRQQIAAGADVIKVYGSTGSADDVTGFQTYTYEEMRAIRRPPCRCRRPLEPERAPARPQVRPSRRLSPKTTEGKASRSSDERNRGLQATFERGADRATKPFGRFRTQPLSGTGSSASPNLPEPSAPRRS